MDKIIEAILLGAIQGITEFLPISSSAHLTVFPWIFNWTSISPSFDVALHIGTLVALCVYFFKDGIELIKSGLAFFIVSVARKSKLSIDDEKKKKGKVFWYIVLATIPAGILSLILDKVSNHIAGISPNAEIICIAIASVVMGLILYFTDRKCSIKKDYDSLSLKDTLIIGISQAFAAAFPGVSRSGITISTARISGYDRESSSKISFLLSIPIILAAVLVKVKDFDLSNPISFFVGIFVSFIIGLFVIKKLMNYLKNGSYKVFAIYRVCFGALIIIALLIKSRIG